MWGADGNPPHKQAKQLPFVAGRRKVYCSGKPVAAGVAMGTGMF